MKTRIALATAACAFLATGNAAEPEREKHRIGDDTVTVSNKKEISIRVDDDPDVKHRELWYARYDGNSWGKWAKHGITFDRNTPISWTPPEGHWKIYLRVTEVSGLSMAEPGSDTEASSEFVIDRTSPTVRLKSPAAGANLKGSAPVTIAWSANDLHLHSTPVTISYSRDGKSFAPIAENIKNSGSFEWTTPRDMTATGIIRVEVVDKALNRRRVDIGRLTIDAIAPRTSIKQPSIAASRQVTLGTSALDAGPAGLDYVTLWYSQDRGTTWVEGPTVTKGPFDAIAWQAPGDGDFLLNLRATDHSGNTSAMPRKASDSQFSVTVDTEVPKVTLANNLGVKDVGSESEGALRRIFKPGDEVVIPFIGARAAAYYLQVAEDGPWQLLAENRDPSQPFSFTLPDVGSSQCRVRVAITDNAGNIGEAISSEAFRIDNEVTRDTVEIDL